MYPYQLDQIVNALAEGGLLANKDAARETLVNLFYGEIHLTWGVDDVLSVCPGLTTEEAVEVLEEVFRHHDASLGVNWDTLSTAASELFPDKDSDEE